VFGQGRKSPRYIYIYLLIFVIMGLGVVLRLLGPSPAAAEWGHSWAVRCLWVRLGFFFLKFYEVSVLSLVVHCSGGESSYRLHVCGGSLVRCIQASTLFCSFYP